MQVLQAGPHKYLLLEFELQTLLAVAKQAGFECRIEENSRCIVMDLSAEGRKAPLLLFDAADPGNLGWFSRCQFYVDGQTGTVLQTPFVVSNVRERSGRVKPNAVRVSVFKELPASFRLPGKQPVTEHMVYAVLFNFLTALRDVGVGVCGAKIIKPLAGRADAVGVRS